MEYNAKDKYYSMKRAYDRLKTVNVDSKIIIDGRAQSGVSNTDPRDTTEEFFSQCYHFKDWLKKDTSITIIRDVEDFINKSATLSIAADYCNSFKHAGLDKKSRSGQEIEKMNTHVNIDLTPRGVISFARLELTISGKKYNAFLLATDCMKEWDDFLEQNLIKLPAP